MTILLSDPLVRSVPVLDNGERLVTWGDARVRAGLAARLHDAEAVLPDGLRLYVVEGHRAAAAQQRILAAYSAELCRLHPGISPGDLERLSSRFVAPLEVAPHVAGAAVDLTLVDGSGVPLDLGTPIDATPEDSDGACWFAARNISRAARHNRSLLAEALTAAGLVNYPTEWWHWSFGDRYWALTTGADAALYGPVADAVAA
jgi:D-alanyl-D-alanine dipeptidase